MMIIRLCAIHATSTKMSRGYSTKEPYQEFWEQRAAMYPHRAFGSNDPAHVKRNSKQRFISIAVTLKGKQTRMWGFESESDRDDFLRYTSDAEMD